MRRPLAALRALPTFLSPPPPPFVRAAALLQLPAFAGAALLAALGQHDAAAAVDAVERVGRAIDLEQLLAALAEELDAHRAEERGARRHVETITRQILRIETNLESVDAQLAFSGAALGDSFRRELSEWRRQLNGGLRAQIAERNLVEHVLFAHRNARQRCEARAARATTDLQHARREAGGGQLSFDDLRALVQRFSDPLRAALQAATRQHQCALCCDRAYTHVVSCCQHLVCTPCFARTETCPFCRARGARPIELRR